MEQDVGKEILATLDAKKAAAESGDYFKLLDLNENADDAAVKAAYFRLARLVHPDSLKKANLSERHAEAVLLFRRITEANEVLSDPQKRRAWLQVRAAGGTKTDDPAVAEEQSRIAMHQGRLLMNRRAWPQAQEVLSRYVQYKPDDSKGHILLGWCIFQNMTVPLESRLEEARKCWARAVKLDEKNPEAHYHMALYYKEKGELASMGTHIKKALLLAPDHVGAQREKRLLEMRGGGSTPKETVPTPSLGDKLKKMFADITKKKE